MDKPELELLFTMNGKFDSFLTSHADYKSEVKEQLNSLHSKIDAGQSSDKEKFKIIVDEINNPECGLKVRLASLERTRSAVYKSAGMVGGSSTLAAIAYNFKEKIISLFN